MAEKLRDWREAENVVKCSHTFEGLQAEVTGLERELRQAEAAVFAAEQRLVEAEAAARAGGDLSAVVLARADLAAARHTREELSTNAAGVYKRFTLAREELERASATARAATWPVLLEEYRAAVAALDGALERAVAAEEQAELLHRTLEAQFGVAGGWVLSPAGQRIGNGSYGSRRLQRAQFESWRAWVVDCGVDASGLARRLAGQVRALAGV